MAKPVFRRKDEYRKMQSQGLLPPDEKAVQKQNDSGSIAPEAFIEEGVNLLFQSLFGVSLDEAPIDSLPRIFEDFATRVKALPQDDKEQVLRGIDFFVGRVKHGIEPVLREWYVAVAK